MASDEAFPGHSVPPLAFFKMEGCGNDYVFIDTDRSPLKAPFSAEEIRRITDRHTGIGSDGLVLIEASSLGARLAMCMWNADGSPSQMCGNALRCLGLWEYQRSGLREFSIQSGSRLHPVRILATDAEPLIEVQMAYPLFSAAAIPFISTQAQAVELSGLISASLNVKGFGLQEVYLLSMGNPHCVLFVADAASSPVDELGTALETHPAFPERSNIEFVSQAEGGGLYVRTFERGSRETLACGSGACAAHVAAVLVKRSAPCQKILLRGGKLEIEWQGSLTERQPVIMRGPARLVYEGRFWRRAWP